MKTDACAVNMLDNDCRKFWNSVYKMSNTKATMNNINVGGVSVPIILLIYRNIISTRFQIQNIRTTESY